MPRVRYVPAVVSAFLLLATFAKSSAGPLFAGTFLSFDTRGGAADVAIGDLNADGILDLVVPTFITNTVSVMLGNGDGTFGPERTFVTGSDPFSVAIADLNADGKPDLVVANYGSNTLSLMLGNGDGT